MEIDLGAYPKLNKKTELLKRSIILAIRRELKFVEGGRFKFPIMLDSHNRIIKEVSIKTVYFKKHESVLLNLMGMEDLLLILNTIEN